ncbi:S-layer homology domain-containing protein [Paenibacillus sp. HW567]|uniref:S-layer homology domain-containing protein n=1 Tax=Paenibacillus sp. HW567 TaxID=1034769 RepID=UPI0003723DEF|nr:S-layer homology domain-containing protein [Paenibacillus sp. HW567]
MDRKNSPKNSTHIVHQTTKALLTTTVALALLLPGGLAAADSSVTSTAATAVKEAPGQAAATPDASKAKITQDQAVEKLRELFPVLKNATVSSVRLGGDNTYPPSTNQMIWNINWGYELGNTSYGFSSMVDAVSGDLVNTYLSFPLTQETAYYPPKITRAEALERARLFIAAAAPSLGKEDLQLQDDDALNLASGALFGTVQYSFSFKTLKNGLPTSDALMITIDGNGNFVQFNKPSSGLAYPSAKPAVSLEAAQKKFTDGLSVGLYYIPVYKDNQVERWILGWRPQEQGLYPIDAQSGKSIDNDGAEVAALSARDETVPQTKERFQPVSTGKELTAEEAAKLVQQVAFIPADRKLSSQMLGASYPNQKQKVWRLTWEAERKGSIAGFPSSSSAEVDAATGQINVFQLEQFTGSADAKPQPAPAGGKKLTQAEAKKQALALINRLYDQASSELKLAGHDEAWSVLPDGKGFRYEFVRYYKGIPISDGAITLVMDTYGRLQNYSALVNAGVETLKEQPTPAISGSDALKSYKDKYTLKLQYNRTGGYSNILYVEPKVKLVYNPSPVNDKDQYEVLDAMTGKWVQVYPYAATIAPAAVDLKGHPAEKQLTELVKYGVLVPDADGKLKPDQEITVGEWFSLIAKASTPYYTSYSTGIERKAVAGVSSDSKYYPSVSYALSRGWISKDTMLQPDNSLSREQLAVLLASFLKYNKLSAFLQNDTAVSSFSDSADIKDKGAVALVLKLGLLQGDGGKFNPQQKITKADAATVIMKLVELQGKTDQSISQQ